MNKMKYIGGNIGFIISLTLQYTYHVMNIITQSNLEIKSTLSIHGYYKSYPGLRLMLDNTCEVNTIALIHKCVNRKSLSTDFYPFVHPPLLRPVAVPCRIPLEDNDKL